MTADLPVIVLGAGGHAKVLVDAILLSRRTIVGVVDRDVSKYGSYLLGVPVIGNDETVLNYSAEKVLLVNGLGSISSTKPREEVLLRFKELGYQFATILHPSAVVAKNVEINEGSQIMAGAVIQTDTCIGVNAIINTRAVVDHDCIIGDHVHVAPGAMLSGGVQVGNNVHIGTGAIIIQGVRIGQDSVIAAGAVVIDDVPPRVTIIGVPGKVLRR